MSLIIDPIQILHLLKEWLKERNKRRDHPCPEAGRDKPYHLDEFYTPQEWRLIWDGNNDRPTSKALALVGEGGVGKSWLASQLYYKVKGVFKGPEPIMAWIDARGRTEIEILQKYAEAVCVKKGAIQNLSKRDLQAKINSFIEKHASNGRKVFIVIDNLFPGGQEINEQFVEWLAPLRGASHFMVLTSRKKFATSSFRWIEIQRWSKQEFQNIIDRWLDQDASSIDKRLLQKLYKITYGYPLLIRVMWQDIKEVQSKQNVDIETAMHNFLSRMDAINLANEASTKCPERHIFEATTKDLDSSTLTWLQILSVFAKGGEVQDTVVLDFARFWQKSQKSAVVSGKYLLRDLERKFLLQQVKSDDYKNTKRGVLYYQMHDLIRDFANHKFYEHTKRNSILLIIASWLKKFYQEAEHLPNGKSSLPNWRFALRGFAEYVMWMADVYGDSNEKILRAFFEVIESAHTWIHRVYYMQRLEQRWLKLLETHFDDSTFSEQESVYIKAKIWEMQGDIARFYDHYNKAISLYERALRALNNGRFGLPNKKILDTYGRLYWGIGRAESKLSGFKAAEKYYEKALRFFKQAHNLKRVLEVQWALGEAWRRQGYREKAQKIVQEAIKSAKKMEGAEEQLLLLKKQIGQIYLVVNKLSEAKAVLEEALELAQQQGELLQEGYLWRLLGDVFVRNREYNKAQQYYQKALELAQRLDDRLGQAIIYQSLGNMYKHQGQGNYKKSLENLQKAEKMLKEIGERPTLFHVQRSRAETLARMQKYKQSLELYFSLLREVEGEPGFHYLTARLYKEIGQILSKQHDYKGALEYLAKGQDVYVDLQDWRGVGDCLYIKALIFRDQDNVQIARGVCIKALEFYKQAKDNKAIDECYKLLGQLSIDNP